ncbi:hypothetical protein KUL152_05020 [Tenacibaculum sp. KUL152]|nr:hypothetical protein KUL152_05020 [Tenacibaculum sp. KUL152]
MDIKALVAFAALFLSAQANANFITNGDFQTCDFSGWSLDSDGVGAPADTSDFAIVDNAGQCSAQLSTNNLIPDGISNSLFTQLNLSGVANGKKLDLSFDWLFSGFDLQSDDFSDAFFVLLNNGIDVETLLFGYEGGSGTFSTQIDSTYDGYYLEFMLEPGYNIESFSSTFTFDNVSLTKSADVPAPQTSLLLALGLGVVAFRRKHVAK